MIHDQVRHQVFASGEFTQIAPRAQTGIGAGMIDGIESGVRSIDRVIKRQQVHASEQVGKRPIQQCTEVLKSTAGKSIHIGNELNSILQSLTTSSTVQSGIAPCRLATSAPTRFANMATSRRGQSASRPCMKAAPNASPAPTVSATSTAQPPSST